MCYTTIQLGVEIHSKARQAFFYTEPYKLDFIKSLGVSKKNNTSLHINLAGSSSCTESIIYCLRTLRFHVILLQGLYTLVNLRFVNVCEHFII